jgi:hypothetical protein
MQGRVRDLAILGMKIEVVKLGHNHNFRSPDIYSTHILGVVHCGVGFFFNPLSHASSVNSYNKIVKFFGSENVLNKTCA